MEEEIINCLHTNEVNFLNDLKRMYKYLVNHELLDKEGDKRFKEILRNGKSGLHKSYMVVRKYHRQKAKKNYHRINPTNIIQRKF